MTWSGFSSAWGRRLLIALGMAALAGAGSGMRTHAMQDQDPLKFNYNGPMLLIYTIKADRTADFEALWAGIRAGLAKSSKDDLKAFGESLQLFKVKSDQPGPGVYVFRLDPPSSTYSYNPVRLLYDNVAEGGPFTREEADALYKRFEGSYDGIQPLPLVKVGG